VGSLQLSFPLAQSSSYVTAPDQNKVVLQIRAMCRASSSIPKKKFFAGGNKCGKILFSPLETRKTPFYQKI